MAPLAASYWRFGPVREAKSRLNKSNRLWWGCQPDARAESGSGRVVPGEPFCFSKNFPCHVVNASRSGSHSDDAHLALISKGFENTPPLGQTLYFEPDQPDPPPKHPQHPKTLGLSGKQGVMVNRTGAPRPHLVISNFSRIDNR